MKKIKTMKKKMKTLRIEDLNNEPLKPIGGVDLLAAVRVSNAMGTKR